MQSSHRILCRILMPLAAVISLAGGPAVCAALGQSQQRAAQEHARQRATERGEAGKPQSDNKSQPGKPTQAGEPASTPSLVAAGNAKPLDTQGPTLGHFFAGTRISQGGSAGPCGHVFSDALLTGTGWHFPPYQAQAPPF